jgi:hypothetical protein
MQVEGRHTLRRNHTTSVGVEHDRAEDVVVLALAVGGGEVEATARRGASGRVGIENDLVGRRVPWWGSVPSQMMIRLANLLASTASRSATTLFRRLSPASHRRSSPSAGAGRRQSLAGCPA